MEELVILGASGSIGASTLDIAKKNPDQFCVKGISVGKNINRLREILLSFPSINLVTVQKEEDKEELVKEFPHISFFAEDEGLITLIEKAKPTMVVNALVGFVGFIPSLYTIEHDIDLALANKESLVVGGDLINEALAAHPSVTLYPIDSEHVALAKCLDKQDAKSIKRLVITASGGPFRDWPIEKIKDATVEDALAHPSWSMGKKITIDSSTMMNKGFEVIEAMHLFHIPLEKITILIQDESTIHSLVEFVDNSFLADLGPADMRVPIAYALFRKKKEGIDSRTLDIESLSSLHFRKFDINRYPAVELAFRAIQEGGSLPCVLNAANEEAVYAFLDKKISYANIVPLVEQAMSSHRIIAHPTKEDLVYINCQVREEIKKEIERRTK
ncbi:MAG: 1-deoxy-D-xylulose-5-phosphate reductoisomerase [Bacilli bacterium]